MSDTSGTTDFGDNNSFEGSSTIINSVIHGNVSVKIKNIIETAPLIVNKGLSALIELMTIPQVYAAVHAFRHDFKIVQSQLAEIIIYKKIHDCLHNVQIYCYYGIVRNTFRFPADLVVYDDMDDYSKTLRDAVQYLSSIVAGSPITASIVTKWLPSLERAYRELTHALDESSVEKLTNATRLIKQVLQIQPTRLNTSLNDTARKLRLSMLIESLTSIVTTINTTSTVQSQLFTAGLDALTTLNDALIILVNTHHIWQGVEDDLHVAHSCIEYDAIDLMLIWPDVMQRATNLCQDYDDQWLVDLQKETDKLSQALQSDNHSLVKSCFYRYQRETSRKFYVVDSDLMKLCNELERLGVPLAAILRML